MTVFKKAWNNKCLRGFEKNGILIHCWWECKSMQPLWKTVWRFLKKLRRKLQYGLSIYTKNTKVLIGKDLCTPVSITALFTIAKIWKHRKCPWMVEWIKKNVIYIYTHTQTHTQNGVPLNHLKKKMISFPSARHWRSCCRHGPPPRPVLPVL